MRSLLQVDEDEERESQQPEINLSAASLLGLFVGLVLICGVFFGLGYAVGRRPATAPGAALAGGAHSASSNGTAKPASTPGRVAAPEVNTSSLPGADLPTPVSGAQAAQSVDLPIDETPPPELQPSTASLGRRAATAKPLPSPASATVSAPPPADSSAASSPPATAAGPVSGGMMVQVAAVAHQEDANVLVSALRQKGYNAVVRNGTQDRLLHIQIGPYSDRAQALAMRQKLLADGYNAILK